MAHATPDLCDHVQPPRRCRCRATSIPEAAAASWAFSQSAHRKVRMDNVRASSHRTTAGVFEDISLVNT